MWRCGNSPCLQERPLTLKHVPGEGEAVCVSMKEFYYILINLL